MLLTIVKEVPLEVTGAFWATKVENIGESAVTAKPQVNRNEMSNTKELWPMKIGESKQQIPEVARAKTAIFFGGVIWESNPPKAQDIPPIAIIKNDQNETLICISLFDWKLIKINGINAQKA